MYSTLIVLDKPRHLRYTFGVISDFEQAIPGGFMNLFKMSCTGENGFRICRDILYAGLKWEDNSLTLPLTGQIMTETGCLYSVPEILNIWNKIFKALDYDEWTSTRPQTNKEHLTVPELLNEVEKIAYGTLRIQPSELYALTPREFNIMLENFGEVENYRVGMICATIMNSVGGKGHGTAYKISDFVNVKKETKVMSEEEIQKTLMQAFG